MDARRKPGKVCGILPVMIFLTLAVSGQVSHLSKRISVSFSDIPPVEALDKIARIGGFRFSYDASIFKSGKRVTIDAQDTPVGTILEQLFRGEIGYREIGDYVVLSRAVQVQRPRKEKEKGPAGSGQPNRDTLVRLGMKPAPEIEVPEDSAINRLRPKPVDELGLVGLIVPVENRAGSANNILYRHRAFQVSLIPSLSTNGKRSGSYSNAVSVNLLAGYSREVKGIEIGGLINVERMDVRGFQLAGIANLNGGRVSGLQTSVVTNVSMGAVHGMQLTAGVNRLTDSLKGVQVSGACNLVSGKMKGLQFSGIANLSASHVDGCQVATVLNRGKKENNGAQVCGLVNYSMENWGFQLAGLVNIAKKDNRGAQVAGFFNYAKRLNGFQLALVNYTEHLDNGVPVGFLSIIRHDGYYKGEISTDEIFYGNIALRAGVPRFYNIYKTGVGESGMVNFTWGVGTKVPVKKIVSLCFDLTLGGVMTTSGGLRYHGLLTKLTPTLDFRILNHLTLFTGPSVNFYWYYTGNHSRPGGIAPYTLYEKVFTTGPHGIEVWIGGMIGIKV